MCASWPDLWLTNYENNILCIDIKSSFVQSVENISSQIKVNGIMKTSINNSKKLEKQEDTF